MYYLAIRTIKVPFLLQVKKGDISGQIHRYVQWLKSKQVIIVYFQEMGKMSKVNESIFTSKFGFPEAA